jgi:hypothetical protein
MPQDLSDDLMFARSLVEKDLCAGMAEEMRIDLQAGKAKDSPRRPVARRETTFCICSKVRSSALAQCLATPLRKAAIWATWGDV